MIQPINNASKILRCFSRKGCVESELINIRGAVLLGLTSCCAQDNNISVFTPFIVYHSFCYTILTHVQFKPNKATWKNSEIFGKIRNKSDRFRMGHSSKSQRWSVLNQRTKFKHLIHFLVWLHGDRFERSIPDNHGNEFWLVIGQRFINRLILWFRKSIPRLISSTSMNIVKMTSA